MRSPPQPALQNVLVARPGTGPGTVARHDDLLAAAVLAAEDAHESRSRPRSVLARVSRRWSRFSDALRRRRTKDEKRPRDVVAAQVVRFDHRGNVTLDALPDEAVDHIQQVPSHVLLHRERELRMARQESDMDAEAAVSSLRDPSMRRIRQVGARDDDDTLLMLPRVAAISLSHRDLRRHSPRDPEGKRVNLPRVSGLMPTRATNRPSSGLASASPVSSTGKTSSSYDHNSEDHSDTTSDSDAYDGQRHETWDVGDGSMGRRHFCRLPTGLSSKDVEREIDRAVIEIASDGDSDDSDDGPISQFAPSSLQIEFPKSRALSDAHHPLQPLRPEVFARRASSSMQATRRLIDDEEGEVLSLIGGEKSRFRAPQEISMFEDDYLSFQGFQPRSASDGRSYPVMASLLRAKRISSVTDSLSEESEEASNVHGTRSVDSRNRHQRSGLLSPRLRRRREVLNDSLDF